MGRTLLSGAKMSEKTIPLEYANNLIYELEKAFWDERGKGARFRVTTVGRGFFKDKIRPLIQSSDIDQILQTIESALRQHGIATKMTYESEERLLRVKVEGCVHRAIEEKMLAHGIEPFTCLPINLVVLAIEEIWDRPAELAEVKIEDGYCQLLVVLFDKRPTLE
jgi:hypothetical protein